MPRNPWDRQPDESDKAWASFCVYRDLGPDRSLEAAYKRRYGVTSRPSGHFQKWSKDHRWVERARAYDAYVEELQRHEQEHVWLRRRAEQSQRSWDLAQELREKVQQMLRFPLTRRRVDQEDGSTVIIEPTKWALRDVRMMIETVDNLERLATGEPQYRSEMTGAEGRPLLEGLDLSTLTIEEKHELKRILERARDRDTGGAEEPVEHRNQPS